MTVVLDELLLPRARARPHDVSGLEALRLLRMYESIVAVRPLLAGNRDVLDSLLSSSRSLVDAVAARPEGVPPRLVSALQGWVWHQNAENAVVAARELVRAIDAASLNGTGRTAPLFARALPRLASSYERVSIVFGPGIGLGDEITFAQFLRALVERYADARTRVFTLYPGLWRALMPHVHEQQYRRKPLRPFSALAATADRTTELVVLADFELFGLSGEVVKRLPGRDIVELSLGRREVRFAHGVSPWARFDQIERPDVDNYEVLRLCASILLGGAGVERWKPFARPRTRRGRVVTVLVNPLSSKPLPFGAREWVNLIGEIRATSGIAAIRVLVHPGPESLGREYAQSICTRLDRIGVAAEVVTDNGRALSPFTAIGAFIAAARQADLCLTLDTFAAHLAPLLLTPTVAVAYSDNRHFWVPSPWSFYALLDEAATRVPSIAGRLLRQAAGHGSLAERTLGAKLAAATRRLEQTGDVAAVQEVCSALAETLRVAAAVAPAEAQGAEWLRLWLRVASAQRRDQIGRSALRSYVDGWIATDFYKLATTFTNVRRDWGTS